MDIFFNGFSTQNMSIALHLEFLCHHLVRTFTNNNLCFSGKVCPLMKAATGFLNFESNLFFMDGWRNDIRVVRFEYDQLSYSGYLCSVNIGKEVGSRFESIGETIYAWDGYEFPIQKQMPTIETYCSESGLCESFRKHWMLHLHFVHRMKSQFFYYILHRVCFLLISLMLWECFFQLYSGTKQKRKT